MSTISSTQEAYEALCAGELFQVGGRFINPSDIVEVDPNGGTNPIFHLEDGRTVQHDRFKRGDVGDYLADALEYATRGQAQRQEVPPEFNRILVGGAGTVAEWKPEKQVLEGAGFTYSSTQAAVHVTVGGKLYFVDDSGDLYSIDQNKNVKGPIGSGASSNAVATSDNWLKTNTTADGNEIFYRSYDGTNNHLRKVSLDGSNDTELVNFGNTSGGKGNAFYEHNGRVYFWNSNSLKSVDLSSGTGYRTDEANLLDISGTFANAYINTKKENGEVEWILSDGGKVKVVRYPATNTSNSQKIVNSNAGYQLPSGFYDSENGVWYAATSNGSDLVKINPNFSTGTLNVTALGDLSTQLSDIGFTSGLFIQ